jgi:uncharacterized protein (DUF1800 family)
MSTLHPLLEPYQPTDQDPFDEVKAAHLLNRAGFGGTPSEVSQIVKLGPAAAASALLDFPDQSADEQDPKDVPDMSAIAGYPKTFRELREMFAGKSQQERMQLQQMLQKANVQADAADLNWWLHRMAYGPHPLQEKLTFFWHGHFTTSARDERMALLMWEQQELLRKMAAGDFGQFVRAISRNPAMLDYLNNTQNHKGHPNENYARELMELFTLGIGNYTEDDVKESARAFTGWTHDGDQFIFDRRQHDYGSKTFLGKTGNFAGDDIITIILAQPACPKFVASELFSYFVYDNLEEGLADSLGETFAAANLQIRPLMQIVLTSRAFYSSKAIGAQIKSPIQLVIGTCRLLGIDVPPVQQLRGPLTSMGQMPLLPPNVKGWPGGRLWINASTLFSRYNTAVFLASGKAPGNAQALKTALMADAGGPEKLVDMWVQRLIGRPIASSQRDVLLDAARTDGPPEQVARHVVQLIVSMPEYQLC